MKFHLNHTPQKPGFEISRSDKLFLNGSCFSENIGALLRQYKFKTHSNPFGILFNPLSICESIETLITNKKFDPKFILNRGDSFFSYLHHSSVNGSSKEELINRIGSENKNASLFLKETDYLFVTLGSAYYYHHLHLNETIANCHKQPGSEFEKRLLKTDDIVAVYSELIKKLQTFNPKLKLIFTVSPVKHLRDGLIENTISKSTLILSVHEIINQFDNCFYFPAYELITDDLRDYRFYKEDMAHPNDLAVDYVWQKFSECYFHSTTIDLNTKLHKLITALNHQQLHFNSAETEKLKQFIARQKEEIRKLNPEISLD